MFGMYGFGAGYFGDGPAGTAAPVPPIIGPAEFVNVDGHFRTNVAAQAVFNATVQIDVHFRTRVDLETER